jgi:hypothetical protein
MPQQKCALSGRNMCILSPGEYRFEWCPATNFKKGRSISTGRRWSTLGVRGLLGSGSPRSELGRNGKSGAVVRGADCLDWDISGEVSKQVMVRVSRVLLVDMPHSNQPPSQSVRS